MMPNQMCLGHRFPVLVAGLALIFLASPGCSPGETPGYWQGEPITIDGDSDDWDGVSRTQFEKQEAVMAVCNDSGYLYVLVQLGDPVWARSIRIGGLTVWIDTEAGSGKDFGLRFNGVPEGEEMPSAGRERGDVEWQARRQERMRQFYEENPVGLVIIDSGGTTREAVISEDGSEGPAVACDISEGIMAYEFKIPLTASSGGDDGIAAGFGQTVSIGVEWGDMSALRGSFGRGDRPPRPEGGPPGGGREGRRGGRRGMEKQEIWLKTKLAQPLTPGENK